MKKTLLTLVLLSGITSAAHADQKATITCTGSKIVLSVRSPYLGENSPATQDLYVLRSKNMSSDESTNTAYFLDVEPDIGKFGMLVFTGKNEVGGKFQLEINPWTDAGDGTTIEEITSGKISYDHGPLNGDDEPVSCRKE